MIFRDALQVNIINAQIDALHTFLTLLCVLFVIRYQKDNFINYYELTYSTEYLHYYTHLKKIKRVGKERYRGTQNLPLLIFLLYLSSSLFCHLCGEARKYY